MSEETQTCAAAADCPFSDEAAMEKLAEKAAEKAAERAAERAIEKLTDHLYREVGKSVVEKLFYLIGVCAVALYLWLQHKGVIS